MFSYGSCLVRKIQAVREYFKSYIALKSPDKQNDDVVSVFTFSPERIYRH